MNSKVVAIAIAVAIAVAVAVAVEGIDRDCHLMAVDSNLTDSDPCWRTLRRVPSTCDDRLEFAELAVSVGFICAQVLKVGSIDALGCFQDGPPMMLWLIPYNSCIRFRES